MCVLVLARGKVLVGVDDLTRDRGWIRVLIEKDIKTLTQVTKKKKSAHSIRMHFCGEEGEEGEGGRERPRGLSQSLSSTIGMSSQGQGGREGAREGAREVVEIYSTEYLSIVEELKKMVMEAQQAEDEGGREGEAFKLAAEAQKEKGKGGGLEGERQEVMSV